MITNNLIILNKEEKNIPEALTKIKKILNRNIEFKQKNIKDYF
jgi:hypothetical protein